MSYNYFIGDITTGTLSLDMLAVLWRTLRGQGEVSVLLSFFRSNALQ